MGHRPGDGTPGAAVLNAPPFDKVKPFSALFAGLDIAFGTGKGEWVKRPLRPEDWLKHLQGDGPGIGVAPLRQDNTVMFAAIDLDEPDFDAAREMQEYIPGVSWLESSRSGNAHVWVFFSEPCPAWLAMGVLKEATLAAGKKHVEVFPKNHDFARVKLGNYINLPWHGLSRPIARQGAEHEGDWYDLETELGEWLKDAAASLNDPKDWQRRAALMLISPPNERERTQEFGQQSHLHMCAEYIIENAESNPVVQGHRSNVYFALAKMLTNWEACDSGEALDIMRSVNEASPDTISDQELCRILGNAERGQFTSTGCDDPVVIPYAHPDCPIANPRSR